MNLKACRYGPDVDVHEAEEKDNEGRQAKYTYTANLWVYFRVTI
jgi:hypothetical protein